MIVPMEITEKLVKVNGQNMGIYTAGEGEHLIVLLPGWNILPAIEFAPLIRELAKKYTVCTIDYFGYGRSDSTSREHTNENYVQEIRAALSAAGLKPPYVLMPYSCSGVYAEYYAAMHPCEIEGLVLLDSTFTHEELDIGTPEDIERVQNTLIEAAESIAAANLPPIGTKDWHEFCEEHFQELYPLYLPYGYTKEEANILATTLNHIDTVIAQIDALPENVREVMLLSTKIADTVPVLVINAEPEDDKHERAIYARLEKLGQVKRSIIVEGSEHGDIHRHVAIIRDEIDSLLK